MRIIFLLSFLATFYFSQSFAKSYDLEIKKQNVFITGKSVEAITINGSIPGPTLNFTEGEDVVINVNNSMDEKTSIHWHGILLPGNMDGVPGLNGFEGIAPHTTFTYKFKIRQKGTYWYHSHSNLQEAQGVYGAIIVDSSEVYSPCLGGMSSCEAKRSRTMGVYSQTDREYVILLSDFSEENPNTILNNLKMDSGYYNYNKRTVATFFSDVKENGFFNTASDYMDWGAMRMDPTDLSDVSKYHFLVNGKTAKQNYTAIFKKGERIKLRFINASAMTIYDVAIPGLKMKLVEADGQPVKPVMIDEFRFGVAETYDVIVEPQEEKAYTIFAESLDRMGYARATLAPKIGVEGKIPKMRPRALLTMADMKMDGMDHDMSDMKSGWEERGTPQGRKALEYSDLISLNSQKDLRQPNREIEFKFGGTMTRYIWTINGEKFPKPVHLKYGERVRLKFTNDTMMAHPIHLHGMFMQMENGQSIEWMPNKHTVIVPPAQSVSMLLTADEEGEWAFHCHLLMHMASGMMTSISVDKEKNAK